MQSKSRKLLAALTMLVAIGLFAVMSPAQDQSSQPQQAQPPAQQGQQAQQPAQQGQQAQQPAQQGQQAQQPAEQGQQSNQVSATGCLQKSGESAYSLTDSSTNQTYTLTSSNVDLSAHVGHTVKVTGTAASASASNPSASGQPAGEASQGGQTLDVSSLQMVSDTCSSGGTPPQSQNPPQLF